MNSTWRQTRQRLRINSADLQIPEMKYLGLFESTKNLRCEYAVVVEVDNRLLLRKTSHEAVGSSEWWGACMHIRASAANPASMRSHKLIY